jgi:hypothetical protein
MPWQDYKQPTKTEPETEQPEPFYTTVKYETAPACDKNTPESLRILRWAIYNAVDSYHARTSSTVLNQRIEELFKEYTNS